MKEITEEVIDHITNWKTYEKNLKYLEQREWPSREKIVEAKIDIQVVIKQIKRMEVKYKLDQLSHWKNSRIAPKAITKSIKKKIQLNVKNNNNMLKEVKKKINRSINKP